MNTQNPTRQELMDVIHTLPADALPELANFISTLQNKTELPNQKNSVPQNFLTSIAGIGHGEENVSVRDEEILADETSPIHGWNLKKESQS